MNDVELLIHLTVNDEIKKVLFKLEEDCLMPPVLVPGMKLSLSTGGGDDPFEFTVDEVWWEVPPIPASDLPKGYTLVYKYPVYVDPEESIEHALDVYVTYCKDYGFEFPGAPPKEPNPRLQIAKDDG